MATPQKPVSAKERQRREAQKATTAQEWRSKANRVIEMPSGSYAVLRRPGMERFLNAGYLPDSLRTVLQEQISSASGKKIKPEELTSGLGLNEVAEWMAAMDRIAVQVFVEPKLLWHQCPALGPDDKELHENGVPVYVDIPEDERDPEKLYTDDVDLQDKQFAFQYAVGGDTDLTRFREATASLVDGVPAGADVAVPSERGPVPDGD